MQLVADGGESRVSAVRKEGPHQACSKTGLRDTYKWMFSQKTRQTTAVFCLYFIYEIILGLLEQLEQTGTHVQPHHV